MVCLVVRSVPELQISRLRYGPVSRIGVKFISSGMQCSICSACGLAQLTQAAKSMLDTLAGRDKESSMAALELIILSVGYPTMDPMLTEWDQIAEILRILQIL